MGLFTPIAQMLKYQDLLERAHCGPDEYARAARIIIEAARNGDDIAAEYAERLIRQSASPSSHAHLIAA